ncbi:glycosyltransferase [Thalassospira povalilytica]|nr:glycosyltransferase [Thalassospira povalilytica]
MICEEMKQNKIGYLLKSGRSNRLVEGMPTEFLYGYPQLKKFGYDINLIGEEELSLEAEPSKIWKVINHITYVMVGVPGWAFWRIFCKRKVFDSFDVVFTTTNTFGICLSLLSRLRLIDCKVVFLAMGLIDLGTPKRWVSFYGWALKTTRVLALSNPDARNLSKTLARKVEYLPFGVDAQFWTPAKGNLQGGDFVLSIGSDRHRDYKTLIAAWRSDFPTLKIVTKLPVQTSKPNIEIISGDWHSQVISDAEIRDMYRNAKFVVLPIRNTFQPSGQSAALQAMACGKAVVITDFQGLWNRELMQDQKTCFLSGPPGDIAALQGAIAAALQNQEDVEKVGAESRCCIEINLNVNIMASCLMNEF